MRLPGRRVQIESTLFFEVPIYLGHEAEIPRFFTHSLSGLRPEGLRRDGPGSFKDFRPIEHGHIAAYAVALPGDFH
jgi:hypothetical protein